MGGLHPPLTGGPVIGEHDQFESCKAKPMARDRIWSEKYRCNSGCMTSPGGKNPATPPLGSTSSSPARRPGEFNHVG